MEAHGALSLNFHFFMTKLVLKQNFCRKNTISLRGWSAAFSVEEWLSSNTQKWVYVQQFCILCGFVISSKLKSILKHVFFQIHLHKTLKNYNAYFLSFLRKTIWPTLPLEISFHHYGIDLSNYLMSDIPSPVLNYIAPQVLNSNWTDSGSICLTSFEGALSTQTKTSTRVPPSTDGTAALFASGKSCFASWKKKARATHRSVSIYSKK